VKSSIRDLASSGGAVAAARAFDLATSYVFYIVLARAAGVQGFGRLVLAITIAQTTAVITRLGLETAAMRKTAEARAAGESRVGHIVLVGASVAGIVSIAGMALLALAIAFVPRLGSYRDAFAGVNGIVLITIPILGISPIVAGTLRGYGGIRAAAIAESVLQPGVSLLMVCIALWSGNPAAAAAALLVSTLATLIYSVFRLHAAGALHRGGSASGMIRLGLTIVVYVGLNALGAALDLLVLGRLRGAAEVALYAAAVKTGRGLLLVSEANTVAIAPSIPHLLRRGDLEHLGLMYRTSLRWIALLTAPAALLFFIAPELILRLFGTRFAAAAPLLRMHAIVFAIFAFAGPAKSYLLMAGRERWLTANAALTLAINAALQLTLVPRYGAMGAVVALLLATLIQRVLLVAKVRTAVGVEPIGRRNAILLASFALAIGAWALALPAGRIAAGAAAMLVFLAGALAAGFDAHDRDVVRGALGALRRA
jgi:O-antigen/teichoic acid export membrane protein